MTSPSALLNHENNPDEGMVIQEQEEGSSEKSKSIKISISVSSLPKVISMQPGSKK
jgi:hypothetical protein